MDKIPQAAHSVRCAQAAEGIFIEIAREKAATGRVLAITVKES